MTNAEKYKNEIRAQERKTGDWAVDKHTNKIVDCNGFSCIKCLFWNDCDGTKIRWLLSEYKEPKEFTDEERKFMELLDKMNWVARDKDGEAWAFNLKPHKNNFGSWITCEEDGVRLSDFTSLPFAAIKSTDTEPTSRAEILGEK